MIYCGCGCSAAARWRRSGPWCRCPREDGMKAGDEVTIGGRVFTVGAVYAPVAHTRYPYDQRGLLPLRLVGHDPAYPWPEGRVLTELVGVRGLRTQTRRLSGRAWARWAGEPIGDGPGDGGR